MKIILYTLSLLAISASQALAHEGEEGITNLAEADWVGPLTAFVIITIAIVIARKISAQGRSLPDGWRGASGGKNKSKK